LFLVTIALYCIIDTEIIWWFYSDFYNGISNPGDAF